MRNVTINRKTKETDISLYLNLDGTGKSMVDTGCGFLNHMLTLFASHGRFDLNVTCKGDIDVDFHHSAEDIGICLGQAFEKALGDKKGIYRYGSFILPMDETLILTAVDISGRCCLCARRTWARRSFTKTSSACAPMPHCSCRGKRRLCMC